MIGIITEVSGDKKETKAILSNNLWEILKEKASIMPVKTLCPIFWSLVGPNTKEAARMANKIEKTGWSAFLQNSNKRTFFLYSDCSSFTLLYSLVS